jgi:hypothetical protein
MAFRVHFVLEREDDKALTGLTAQLAKELPSSFEATAGLWKFRAPERFPTVSMVIDEPTPLDALSVAVDRVKAAHDLLGADQPAFTIQVEPADKV